MADYKAQQQNNYETAIRLGWEDLENKALGQTSANAGAEYNADKGRITLDFLGESFQLLLKERKITSTTRSKPAKQWQEIILLHYLRDAKGTPPTGKIISYKEIPGARAYWPNFQARVHNILIKAFGQNPEKLLDASARAGLKPAPTNCAGDVNVKIKALPRVELLIQMWKGDDEFAPETSVVFDSSIADYLPAEDITVLCQMTAIQLMKTARSGNRLQNE